MICPYIKVAFSDTTFEISGCRVLFRVVFSYGEMARKGIPRVCFHFVLRNGILSCVLCVLFRGMIWNWIPRVCSYFLPRNGIPSCFLCLTSVRNGITWVCFYFCSTECNSELFYLPRKGSKRNSESFLFRGTAGIPSEIKSFFQYIPSSSEFFLSEIPNPKRKSHEEVWWFLKDGRECGGLCCLLESRLFGHFGKSEA